jgi:hypothetical protein
VLVRMHARGVRTSKIMSDTANVPEELFEGETLLRWERSLGLQKSRWPRAAQRTLVAILIAWVPLAILAAVQVLILSDETARSFFSDIAVHVRFLVAVPALIFAEAECIPRLVRIVNHFSDTGLVAEPDKSRFLAAVFSTHRLFNSTVSNVIRLVLVYVVIAALALSFSADVTLAWHRRGSTGAFHLSPAGWWHALVSLPLLLLVFFGWLWRLILWTRFLFLVSRLDLQLIPGHTDGAGGLKFLSSSLRGFRLISFACGAIVAGSIADQVLQGKPPLAFKNLVIVLMVFLVILFAGPLTIFLKKLRQTKGRGIFEYGALARNVGAQFEAKWLRQESIDHAVLEVQDFSAANDLFTITHNAYAMREVPFTLRDLIGPIGVSALLPFIPLALLVMPLEVLLRGVVKLLF